jgi:hypothetical protein
MQVSIQSDSLLFWRVQYLAAAKNTFFNGGYIAFN